MTVIIDIYVNFSRKFFASKALTNRTVSLKGKIFGENLYCIG